MCSSSQQAARTNRKREVGEIPPGSIERGEHTKVIHVYLGGLISSAPKSGNFKQGFVNRARSEGLSEVGLPHSSDENGENRGSEGGNKSAQT